jgi:TolB-like protein/Tfp pilus assembly protein PilF
VKVVMPVGRLQKMDAVRKPNIIEKHTFAEIISEEMIEETPELQKISSRPLDGNAQKLPATGNAALWKRRNARVALLILVLLTSTIAVSIPFILPSQSEIRTVAVLPLKSLEPNEEDSSLGLKLADALIQRLGRLRQLVVRPMGAVRRYEGKTLDPLAAGREQRVDAVLDGSFQRAGERLHVRVQLLRVSDGKQLWASTFDERSSDPFFLQDALAEQTAQALVPQLAGEQREIIAAHDTESIAAHRLYTEGRISWNRRNLEGLKKSIADFEQAIQLDPYYARAYAGLADSYITLSDYDALPAKEAYPKARAAALKALEVDDTLVEAHTSLAMIKASYEWDWRGADEAFQRAIQVNPNYATAHQWYSEYLAGMGRHEEALAEIRRAQELDPLSLIIRSVEAWVWYYGRDYDQMLAQCQRVIEADPSFGEAYVYLGLAYEQQARFREAMEAFQKYSTLTGYNTPEAAAIRASAISSPADYWRKMVELAKPPTGSAFDAAQAWSQLGEPEKALDQLEKAFANRDYHVMYLKVHPNLDPLRTNPRFQDLLRRTGLAE